jgi:hypothetical protein
MSKVSVIYCAKLSVRGTSPISKLMHFRFKNFHRHLSVHGEKGHNLRINYFKCIGLFLVEK